MSNNFKYVCQKCGSSHAKWAGKCNECGEWNSIEIEKAANTGVFNKVKKGVKYKTESLQGQIVMLSRIHTNSDELDRVLGGGLVPGSAVLIGGEPGIGKSTLLLQLSTSLADNGRKCLYITGEESIEQMRIHAQRLQIKDSQLEVLTTTNVDDIISTIEDMKSQLSVIIVDSIQTMFINDIPSAPGTVSQVRSSAHELITFAKKNNITVILVGHVTKDGQIAGPKVLEHMVDTVLYFEGEQGNNYRILRSIKNRFGNVNEIGIFEMLETGLTQVLNPSSLFLSERTFNISGATVFAGMEGTRPILVEVQALASPTNMVAPRRAVVGWDVNRLSMMIAVLGARYGLNLGSHEVYLNIVGGMKISEPAADLAVISALISAVKNITISKDTIIIGEVGLSGEVRKVSRIETRLMEAMKLGFKNAIIPKDSAISKNLSDLTINKIRHIRELENFFNIAHA